MGFAVSRPVSISAVVILINQNQNRIVIDERFCLVGRQKLVRLTNQNQKRNRANRHWLMDTAIGQYLMTDQYKMGPKIIQYMQSKIFNQINNYAC